MVKTMGKLRIITLNYSIEIEYGHYRLTNFAPLFSERCGLSQWNKVTGLPFKFRLLKFEENT